MVLTTSSVPFFTTFRMYDVASALAAHVICRSCSSSEMSTCSIFTSVGVVAPGRVNDVITPFD